MARLFKRGDIWYAWIPAPGGGTTKRSTNCTDEKAAHARASQLERESLDPDSAAAAKATLRDAFELLIRDRAGKAKAGKGSVETVHFYQGKSGVVLDALAEVLRRSPKAAIFLREVKAGLVDDYVALRREEVEDSTIAKELTTWRAACRLAKRRGWFPQDIEQVFPVGFGDGYTPRKRFVSPTEFGLLYRAMVRSIPVRKPDLEAARILELRARRARGESADELAKAFDVSLSTVKRLTSPNRVDPTPGPPVGHELFAIVCFAIATGAEWSAIWRARRDDIAADLSQAVVRGSKNENRVERPVPISLLEFAFLLDFARTHGDGENGFLFSATHASSFRHRLSEACERAGIPHLAPTDLRRTHGKWLRLAGVAPGAIAPSLGHVDARMVERVYGRSSAAELAHVQRAQIAVTGGLLMGGGTPIQQVKALPGGGASAEKRPDLQWSGPGLNRRHPDFQSSPTPQKTSDDVPDLPPTWAANGQPDGDTGTAPAEAVPSRGDASDPPSKALVGAAIGLAVVRTSDALLEDAFTVAESTLSQGSRQIGEPVDKNAEVLHRDVKPANVRKPPAKASPRVLEETKKRSRGGRS